MMLVMLGLVVVALRSLEKRRGVYYPDPYRRCQP